MPAHIVSLDVSLGVTVGRPRIGVERAGLGAHGAANAMPRERHEWRGASGRRYPHTVYGLIECPPLPAASYVLVRRDAEGRRVALRVGLGVSDAPTLNLAQIRQAGARVGANEVHVGPRAGSESERRLVACDLRVGLLGSLAADPGPDA